MANSIEANEAKLRGLLEKARKLAMETSPITPDMAAAAPTWRAAYSDRTAALMSALCLIAYDEFEEPTGARLETMRIRLARGGFKLIRTYDPVASTQAYLAVSEQFAVLAFRGTTDTADWRSNLDAGLMPLDPQNPLVQVHRGFLKGFRQVEAAIRKDLDEHVPADRGIYITGHSLGGGIAQIAAAALARDTLAACYTFGSPRVGGRRFDREMKCPHYRVVNAGDIVPGVPPPVFNGYYHNGDVRWLTTKGKPPARYSRQYLRQFFNTLVSLVVLPFKKTLSGIDDHMIWNYEDKLSAVAAARAPVELKDTPPMDAPEIQARMDAAVYGAARRCGVPLADAARKQLNRMTAKAATGIVAKTPLGIERDTEAALGEVLYERLVRDAVALGKTIEGHRPALLTVELLEMSLATLGPFPPLW